MKKLPAEFVNSLIIRSAFIAAFLYIIYFFFMKLSGLAYITELRFVNYALFCIVGYYALKTATQKGDGGMDYLQGLGVAFVIGAFSFVFFAVFIFLYSLLDPFFTNTVVKEFPFVSVLGRFGAPFLVASEGIGLSAIFSLCLMQYFKIFTTRKRRFIFFGQKRNIISPGV